MNTPGNCLKYLALEGQLHDRGLSLANDVIHEQYEIVINNLSKYAVYDLDFGCLGGMEGKPELFVPYQNALPENHKYMVLMLPAPPSKTGVLVYFIGKLGDLHQKHAEQP